MHGILKKEELIDFHIRYVWQKISRMYNAEALKYDLTMATGFILLNIDENLGTPSTKLGPKMGMEANSLTRIIKSMEESGLIVRKNDSEDKRMVRIFLTKEGAQKKEIAMLNVLNFNNYIYSKLPKKKLEVFIEVMQDINALLEEDLFKEQNKYQPLKIN